MQKKKYKGNNPNKKKSKQFRFSNKEEVLAGHVMDNNITITYPNGIQVKSLVTIYEQQVKTLIRL